MIKIRASFSRNLDTICQEHCDILSDFVKQDAATVLANHNCSNKLTTLLKKLSGNNDNTRREILSCKPDEFPSIHNKYKNCYSTTNEIAILQAVFNYDHFSSRHYSCYELIKKLDLKVCPYCNRAYITPIKSVEKRPPLDHFYPQSIYPLFGLAFYNLIPSCTFCNSTLKLDHDPLTTPIIHPYCDEFGNDANFSFNDPLTCKTILKIKKTKNKDLITNANELFKIEEVYQSHWDIALELRKKALKNNKQHLKSLQIIAKKIKILASTEEEFYQFYFGNYMNEEDFEKRPLAKFTYDLVSELRIINDLQVSL